VAATLLYDAAVKVGWLDVVLCAEPVIAMNGSEPVTVCDHVTGLVVPAELLVVVSRAIASMNGEPMRTGIPAPASRTGTQILMGIGRRPSNQSRMTCSQRAKTDSTEWHA
jgi:hypothetical protein